ncbi:MAG: PilN domain-containing protein [Nitrospirota bacterium]
MRIKINFASKEYLFARKIYLVLTAALAASVVVFIVNYTDYTYSASRRAALTAQLGLQKKLDDAFDKKLSEARKKAAETDVKAAALQAQFANMAIATRAFSWTEFLNRLEEVVPKGVCITGLRPSFASLDIDVSGNAISMDQLTEFMDRMTKSPYFEDIPPVFRTTDQVADSDIGMMLQVFNFKIKYDPDGKGAKKGRPAPEVRERN